MMTGLVLFMMEVHAGAEAAEASKTFSQHDPYGFIMAMLGMGIVFTILILTYFIFSNTPKLYTPAFRQKLKDFFRKKPAETAEAATKEEEPGALPDLTGEVNAAIAAAIHLYRSELHDFEDTVITMKKVSRTYSPWSSKIYGLRNLNQR
ncbi:MAG: OadG family protein [Bacteroidales bacterium]|nr:OadG family protein [Bacteroidales bacterium]